MLNEYVQRHFCISPSWISFNPSSFPHLCPPRSVPANPSQHDGFFINPILVIVCCLRLLGSREAMSWRFSVSCIRLLRPRFACPFLLSSCSRLVTPENFDACFHFVSFDADDTVCRSCLFTSETLPRSVDLLSTPFLAICVFLPAKVVLFICGLFFSISSLLNLKKLSTYTLSFFMVPYHVCPLVSVYFSRALFSM